MSIIKSNSLYFTQGGSDKIYQASVESSGEGFIVNFAYGRRGSTLKQGCKTTSPIDLEKATNIYKKLIKSKLSKGYTEGEDGSVYSKSDNEKNYSGIQCQLLNPIDREEALRLCSDSGFLIQEKFDGERRLIVKKESVNGANRKGLFVGLSKPIQDEAKKIEPSYIVDGEDLGDIIVLFDLIEIDGNSLAQVECAERYRLLKSLFKESDSIKIAHSAFNKDEKIAMLNSMKKQNREGVVFKKINSTYTPGRPSTGGSQLKYKFVEPASFIVESHHESKRSVAISAFDQGVKTKLGNVAIPPSKKMPDIGTVIEVNYLYAFKGGSIFQPVFLHERTDLEASDCLVSQLKYKTDEKLSQSEF